MWRRQKKTVFQAEGIACAKAQRWQRPEPLGAGGVKL